MILFGEFILFPTTLLPVYQNFLLNCLTINRRFQSSFWLLTEMKLFCKYSVSLIQAARISSLGNPTINRSFQLSKEINRSFQLSKEFFTIWNYSVSSQNFSISLGQAARISFCLRHGLRPNYWIARKSPNFKFARVQSSFWPNKTILQVLNIF